jgi:hypothetical protein
MRERNMISVYIFYAKIVFSETRTFSKRSSTKKICDVDQGRFHELYIHEIRPQQNAALALAYHASVYLHF